jgi:hypothetical protein
MIAGKRVIAFNDLSNYTGLQFSTLVTHELAHIFSYSYGWSDDSHHGKRASDGTAGLGSKWLNKADQFLHGGPAPSTYRHASSSSGPEMFADMFTPWIYGVWNQGYINLVEEVSQAMTINMSEWIP